MALSDGVVDDPALWTAVRAAIVPVARRAFLRAFLAGAAAGVLQRPARRKDLETGILTADEIASINGQALRYVEDYASDWWARQVPEVREALRSAIAAAVRDSAPTSTVVEAMREYFTPAKARMIAVTETTRLMGQGAQATYRTFGYTEWEWRTANDALVDPICADLATGGPYPMATPFIPGHPNCRCWPVPVGDSLRPAEAPPEPEAFPVDGFRSPSEAVAWMRRRYPDIEFAGWAGSGIDPRTISGLFRQFDVLARRYPDVAARLRNLNLSPPETFASPNTYAHAYYQGHAMEFKNTYWSQPYDDLVASMRSQSTPMRPGATPWHPVGTESFESVVSHEFGHLVDGYLTGYGENALPRLLTFGRPKASGEGLVSDLFIAVKDSRAVKLSEYAKKDAAEKFAEAFSQMQHAPPSRWNTYTKRVDALLDVVFNQRSKLAQFDSNHDIVWLSDIPLEDRPAISIRMSRVVADVLAGRRVDVGGITGP